MTAPPKGMFFRFDASPELGAGHWRRCLALARECLRRGLEAHLVARTRDVDLAAMGALPGMRLHAVPWQAEPEQDARLLVEICRSRQLRMGVVDHYRQGADYQTCLRASGLRWLQFGNRGHRHPLLGQWLHDASPAACRSDYAARLAEPAARLLLGSRYALLQPEFALARARREAEGWPDKVNKVLLIFGGGDDRGLTAAALGWLDEAGFAGGRVVLTTRANPSLPVLRQMAASDRRVELQVDNWAPAQVMAGCDLAMSTGGTTLHELACLGIPALVLSVAENQVEPAKAWERAGLGWYLGGWPEPVCTPPVELMLELGRRPQGWRRRRARCLAEQDGQGARRVADELLESPLE